MAITVSTSQRVASTPSSGGSGDAARLLRQLQELNQQLKEVSSSKLGDKEKAARARAIQAQIQIVNMELHVIAQRDAQRTSKAGSGSDTEQSPSRGQPQRKAPGTSSILDVYA